MFLLWLNQLNCLKVALELSGRASCWIAFWSSFAPSFVRLQTVLILPLRNVPITGHSRSIGVSHALVRVVVSWAGVNRPPCMLWHIRAQRSWTYVKAVVPGAQFEVLHTTTPVRIRNRVGVQKCVWRLQRYRPVHHFRLFVTCNQADLSTWSNRHPRQKQKEKAFWVLLRKARLLPYSVLGQARLKFGAWALIQWGSKGSVHLSAERSRIRSFYLTSTGIPHVNGYITIIL